MSRSGTVVQVIEEQVIREDGSSGERALLGLQSHFRVVGGYRMHYLDEGSGPVVVMVHGNPTWCYLYRNLARSLRDSFRIIAPDHLGCGLSERTTGHTFRAQDRVDHLEELLDSLGIKKFSLVMHDWGGSIGTALAQRRINDVEKLFYFNTTLGEIDQLPRIIRLAASPFIGEILTKYTKTFIRLTTSIGACRTLSPEVRRGYEAPYQTALARQAIWDFVSDIPFFSAHPSFAQKLNLEQGLVPLAKKPVKIMWGLKDPCFHPGFLRKMKGYFPLADIEELPTAAHLVPEDEPERAATALRAFLQQAVPVAQPTPQLSSVYGAVREAVARDGDGIALIVPSKQQGASVTKSTFGALWRLVQQYRRGLVSRGMLPGDRVLMLVPPGIDFIAFTLAILGNGGIPVFVDPGVGTENLKRCIDNAGVIGVISVPRAVPLRAAWFRQFQTVRYHCLVSELVPLPGTSGVFRAEFEADELPEVERSGVEMIAYTSGGTGVPKGVLFSPQMLKEQMAIFDSVFGYRSGQIDLPLLPIFSLFDVALGVTAVIPPIDPGAPLSFDPEQLAEVITLHQVTSSFGSPTLWRKLAEWAIRGGHQFPSITRVFIAGAPVSDSVIETVRAALPDGEVYVPYGATEALPVSVITGAERLTLRKEEGIATSADDQQGLPIGRTVPGLAVQVMPLGTAAAENSWGDPCETGEIGELWVSGPTVSRGYLHRTGDSAAKRFVEGRWWHALGDVGYLDREGMAYFCGRAAHIVRGARLWCPIPVEQIVNQVSGVRRSALVDLGEGRAGVVVEPEDAPLGSAELDRGELIKRVTEELERNNLTKEITEIFFHPSFPVDGRHNAKIFRDRLSLWAQAQGRSLRR